MMWDMSQLYSNPGFLDAVSSDLGLPASGGGGTTTSATATTLKTLTKTTTTTAATSTATGTVGQWSQVSSKEAKGEKSADMNGQCGGIGYTGSTVCTPPYVCVTTSVWWAQCQ